MDAAVIVVICFQISIFEPLKTTDLLLQHDFQWITERFRKRKKLVFNNKSRPIGRDLLFQNNSNCCPGVFTPCGFFP